HLPVHRLRPDHRRGAARRRGTQRGGRTVNGARLSTTVRDVSDTAQAGRHGTLGTSPVRPDGVAKVQGTFAFSSDLHADGALWGATLRSPHPYARIVSIDIGPAWRVDGVAAVLTADDVPGEPTYGLITADQPVFAADFVRYVGQPIA